MQKPLSRKDFIKLAGLAPLSIIGSNKFERILSTTTLGKDKNNVLIIIFDAWSAYHLSMLGYGRETMPYLTKAAESAIIYHNHYAGGNFTTPGTASILTGTLPWTNRALQPNGTVEESLARNNIFHTFKDYYKIAYTHNPWANKLLEQFSGDINELVPRLSLFLATYDQYIRGFFKKDEDIASTSWTRNINISEQGFAYSIFLSLINETIKENNIRNIKGKFPRGIPSIGTAENSFILEDAINWVGNRLPQIPEPFMGYFHFLPPHGPYRTSYEFYNKFTRDGFTPIPKPLDEFNESKTSEYLLRKRSEYDEFLLYVDQGFRNLFESLRINGILKNTWVIITSDHGEMFERGMDGHSVAAMYQPVIRVPLMIFEPGVNVRKDIYEPTSAIDILPTLLHVTGQEIPTWIEGEVLPPYREGSQQRSRSIFSVRSNKTKQFAQIKRGSFTLTRDGYKLHYYIGYEERGIPELVKLYNLENDPEELENLANSESDIKNSLYNEIKTKLREINQPYV